jgi:hypothetical protein
MQDIRVMKEMQHPRSVVFTATFDILEENCERYCCGFY